MTIQKKSLISTLNTTKKAIVASSPTASSSAKCGRPRAGRKSRTAKRTNQAH